MGYRRYSCCVNGVGVFYFRCGCSFIYYQYNSTYYVKRESYIMIQTKRTPGCQGSEIDWAQATDRNDRIDAKEFRYLYCEQSGVIRLENVPDNLGDYYPSDYYASVSNTHLTLPTKRIV